MQNLILSRQPEPTRNLVKTPVKERERISIELVSKRNLSAMDAMGLSWIFQEEDYS